jgi:hypothetical protein
MGACDFQTCARGKDAREAFNNAVKDAQYDHGHSGYSGTIAEKHAFVMIDAPPDTDPLKFAEELIAKGDNRIDDKWGPAGCIKLPDGAFLFFGWASS